MENILCIVSIEIVIEIAYNIVNEVRENTSKKGSIDYEYLKPIKQKTKKRIHE